MDAKQDVCLYSRKMMELCGIDEVLSFTDSEITLSSVLGMIAIEGNNLKIENFSTENGSLKIVGEIDSFYYFGKKDGSEKHGLFAKLFR